MEEENSGYVMLPSGISFEDLKMELIPDEGTGKEATLNYYYEDRLLGSARAKVSDSYIEDHSAQVKDISGEKAETEKEGKSLVSVAILAAAVVLLLILILLFIRVIRKRKQRRRRRRRRRR